MRGASRSPSSESLPTRAPSGLRSKPESMAYPRSNSQTFVAKLQYFLRNNSRACLATVAFFVFVLVVASDSLHDLRQETGQVLRRHGYGGTGDRYFGGAVRAGYFLPQDAHPSSTIFKFAAVTDLDQLSRVGTENKWKSIFLPGSLTYNPAKKWYIINMDSERELITKHNEGGRGAEFSELVIYDNRLLTFDDRTGDVFEILNNPDGHSSFCVPRFVVTEGPGETDKGMKWEWATVKNNLLYMGSMGKEYTKPDGSIVNRNNLWIATLNQGGELQRHDWTHPYQVVREALGAKAPGYVIIEAVNWSDSLRKWVFLPRRISPDKYDDVVDEKKGGNKLVLVSEDFTDVELVTIKFDKDPLRGFSTFAFVPGTKDHHAMCIQSVEDQCVEIDEGKCTQKSYFFVFDVLTGEVLSEQIEYEKHVKFEGLEFVDAYTKPPPLHTS